MEWILLVAMSDGKGLSYWHRNLLSRTFGHKRDTIIAVARPLFKFLLCVIQLSPHWQIDTYQAPVA